MNDRVLNNIVSESINKVINEIGDTAKGQAELNAVKGRAAARLRYHNGKYGSAKKQAELDSLINRANDEAWDGYSNADDDTKRFMQSAGERGYRYGYQKGIDEPSDEEKALKEHIKKLVRESIYEMGGQFESSNEGDDVDNRESDEKSENQKQRQSRKSVISYFKKKGVNHAPFAYKLYGVEQEEGKDTNDMKNARSKFEKCLNGEPNENGYPYSFSSAEINRLISMASNNNLSESKTKRAKQRKK